MINEYQNLYICGSQPWVRVLQRYVRNPKGYAKKFKVVNETAINLPRLDFCEFDYRNSVILI